MAQTQESKSKVTSEMEKIDNNKIKLTISISPEFFREGLTSAYNRNKGYFNIPGFRKGKAPRKVIEQMYGRDVFHEDAVNTILPDAYEAVLDEHDLEPVYKPEIAPGEMSEKEGAVFYAEIYLRPEVEIDGYYGLTYPKGEPDATEDEIQQALRSEQEKNSRQVSVDRPAEMGDIVTINFKGFMDGEPFEGGAGENHDLTLGSKQFIDNFEEQLAGHVPGDDLKVEVTFPEEYHHAEYAGKPAVFEVEILDVKAKEMPEIDDEFAQDVSEFETLAEYRADLAEKIKENKEKNLENSKRSHVMKQLIAAASMDVPEAMYLARLDDMFENFSRQIQMRGMDVENYMRFTQMTEQSLKASWRQQAEDEVKGSLALEAVSKKENMEIGDEEFASRLGEIMEAEGDELSKMIENMHKTRRKELERSMLCEKALDFVMEKATATDGPLVSDDLVLEEE